MSKGLVVGSFDPITFGHLSVIEEATRVCDELIVAVGDNIAKKGLFDIDHRMQMIGDALEEISDHIWNDCKITVMKYSGLTTTFAKEQNVDVIFRGVRDTNDFNFEMKLCAVNETLDPDIGTMFIPSYLPHVSSSAVREIASVSTTWDEFMTLNQYVPECVYDELRLKFEIEEDE